MKGPKSSGLSNEEASIFLATGLTKVEDGGGDDSEDIAVFAIDLRSAESWLSKCIDSGIKVDPGVYTGMWFASRHIVCKYVPDKYKHLYQRKQ